MKIISIFFIFFIFIYSVNCQPSGSYEVSFHQPEFKKNPPKWTYTVYDSTNIGFPVERYENFKTDGYNMISIWRPNTWSPVVVDKYFYTAAMSTGTTSHIFGSVVQKIDIETGIPVWTSIFDNRNIEKQEYVQQLFLDNGVLKILTQRRIKDRFDDFVPQSYNIYGDTSTICIREYDSENGDLLDVKCQDPEDTSVFYVLPNSEMRRILFKNADGSYQFIENRSRATKRVELSHLDEKEKLLEMYIDTFYYDKNKYSIDTIRMYTPSFSLYKPNEDSLITIHVYGSNGIYIPDLSYLTIYNKELKKVKLISLKHLYLLHNDYSIFTIKKAWKDRVLIRIGRLGLEGGHHVSTFYLDYNGNILANYDSEDFENDFPFYTTYLPKSDKYLLMTYNRNTNNKKYFEEFKLNFYLYENGKWEFKHRIEFADSHFIGEIYSLNELDNHDILMCTNSKYFDKNKNLTSLPTETWMRIDGLKLGLVNSIDKISNIERLRIFPNPAKNSFNVEFPSIFNGNIEVLDILGRIVKKINIRNSSEKNINVSDLKYGTYYIKAYSVKGCCEYSGIIQIIN